MAAVTVTIDGAFTEQRQSTQLVGPPEVLEHEVIDVRIPFSMSFDLSVDPNAPVVAIHRTSWRPPVSGD